MDQYNTTIRQAVEKLKMQIPTLADPQTIFKEPEFKKLYGLIKEASSDLRPELGRAINQARQELEALVITDRSIESTSATLDPTAPFDINTIHKPAMLPLPQGSLHPLMKELEFALDIFERMGFTTIESRQLDDDYHMFASLNFPQGHPARDDYDTFMTDERLVAAAHTSTMQNRIMRSKQPPIHAVSYGICFRNEDLDATHEHTFYQLEGVFVDEGLNLGDMISILQTFFEEFFGQKLNYRTQPAYFPFVEPGLEFLIEKPKSIHKSGDWLEVLGGGMTHPNVLKEAGIDPTRYSGFAWGGGLDRLVMLKYGIEDIRHLRAARLEFLRKFQS